MHREAGAAAQQLAGECIAVLYGGHLPPVAQRGKLDGGVRLDLRPGSAADPDDPVNATNEPATNAAGSPHRSS
ncbi:hypothetical protein GCM10010530_16650 [Kribbella aluminosa]